TQWFVLRAATYFFVWLLLAFVLRRWSHENDQTGALAPMRRARAVSALGLVLYILTMTLAAVDWILSRDAHWFSTVIGLMIVIGQAASGLCLLILMVTLLSVREPLADAVRPAHFIDLGNLLLTLVILWAYVSFSQFLVIWMGNLKDDVSWYTQRGLGAPANGWRWIALLLIVFHFFVPFLLLLSRNKKRHARTLAMIAGGVLLMRALDVYWMIAPGVVDPAHHPGATHVSWLDPVALVGVGGVWMALFLWQLQNRPLLARFRAGAEELTGHGNTTAGTTVA
ncbi:MAG: hypothetical protein ACREJC_01525, partial [Tepidisphaeraceae bacterium]